MKTAFGSSLLNLALDTIVDPNFRVNITHNATCPTIDDLIRVNNPGNGDCAFYSFIHCKKMFDITPLQLRQFLLNSPYLLSYSYFNNLENLKLILESDNLPSSPDVLTLLSLHYKCNICVHNASSNNCTIYGMLSSDTYHFFACDGHVEALMPIHLPPEPLVHFLLSDDFNRDFYNKIDDVDRTEFLKELLSRSKTDAMNAIYRVLSYGKMSDTLPQLPSTTHIGLFEALCSLNISFEKKKIIEYSKTHSSAYVISSCYNVSTYLTYGDSPDRIAAENIIKYSLPDVTSIEGVNDDIIRCESDFDNIKFCYVDACGVDKDMSASEFLWYKVCDSKTLNKVHLVANLLSTGGDLIIRVCDRSTDQLLKDLTVYFSDVSIFVPSAKNIASNSFFVIMQTKNSVSGPEKKSLLSDLDDVIDFLNITRRTDLANLHKALASPAFNLNSRNKINSMCKALSSRMSFASVTYGSRRDSITFSKIISLDHLLYRRYKNLLTARSKVIKNLVSLPSFKKRGALIANSMLTSHHCGEIPISADHDIVLVKTPVFTSILDDGVGDF